ncbi:CDP-diacylglycerol diphosphatase [Pseudomonas marginalis]|uniref:CDP-diacylglycerol diphosphatase n=1 Tax=Pseudomonas marginalis TaxID=298 RepID=UPI003BA04432
MTTENTPQKTKRCTGIISVTLMMMILAVFSNPLFADSLAAHEAGHGNPNILLQMVQSCLTLSSASTESQCAQCPTLPNFSRLGHDTSAPNKTIACLTDPRLNNPTKCEGKMQFWNDAIQAYFSQAEERRDTSSPFARYLAIQDAKMCNCAKAAPGGIDDFVHGLVIPRDPMTGVEEQEKYATYHDAWALAWNLGLEKMSQEAMVLVANPPIPMRSQNQLHIHMAQLKPGARKAIDMERYTAQCTDQDGLDGCVWDKVVSLAHTAGYVPSIDQGYGVAVMRSTEGDGWTIAVVAPTVSTEEKFTVSGRDAHGNLECSVQSEKLQ